MTQTDYAEIASRLQTEKKEIKKKFDAEHLQWEEMYHLDDYVSKGFQWRQQNGIDLCREFIQEHGSILDIGCGTGHASFTLANLGYKVLGMDISSQMIDQARKNTAGFTELDCEFIALDFLKSPSDGRKFDGIIALGFIEYFDDPEEMLQKMGEYLNPNGIIVMQIWNKNPLADNLFRVLYSGYAKLRHPTQTIKSVVKYIAPKKMLDRFVKKRPQSQTDPNIYVKHLRYSPNEFEAIAVKSGYTVVGSRASRFFPTQFLFGDDLRIKLDGRLQKIAEKNTKLRKKAVNYTFALMKD